MKENECVDPRDILTGGALFTAKQLELNMTLPYETCATELVKGLIQKDRLKKYFNFIESTMRSL